MAACGHAFACRRTPKSREASMSNRATVTKSDNVVSATTSVAECFSLAEWRKPRRPSSYLTSGAPRQCAHCAAPFGQHEGHLACWHGADKGYYCSETCATAHATGVDKH